MKVDIIWKDYKIVDGFIWYTYNYKLFGFLPSDPLGRRQKEIQVYEGPGPDTSFVQCLSFYNRKTFAHAETLCSGSYEKCQEYFYNIVEERRNPDIYYCGLTGHTTKVLEIPE